MFRRFSSLAQLSHSLRVGIVRYIGWSTVVGVGMLGGSILGIVLGSSPVHGQADVAPDFQGGAARNTAADKQSNSTSSSEEELPATLPGDDAATHVSDDQRTRPAESTMHDGNQLGSWVASLIEQLAHPSFHRRQNAQWQLQQLGIDAFEQLQAATKHPNIQIATSARYIIDSQNIVWWLESDSVEVRSYLKDYNNLDEDKRSEKILLLRERGTLDALVALCRLSRYERYETLSKRAALALLSALTDESAAEKPPGVRPAEDAAALPSLPDAMNRGQSPGRQTPSPAPEVLDAIERELGESQRTAVKWIRSYLEDVRRGHLADVERWERLTQEEMQRVQEQGRETTARDVLELYRWVGSWVARTASRDAALQLLRPSLELVGDSAYGMREFCIWALDHCRMPELVEELAAQRSASFDTYGELKYLLAESYLQRGQRQRAEQLASAASDALGNPPPEARRLAQRLGVGKDIALNRFEAAMHLAGRGMFDWAEQEFRRSLEQDVPSYEEIIRLSFAEFYWNGGEYAKAAEVLAPLVGQLPEDLVQRRMINPQIQANYHYYRGLAAAESGQWDTAREALRRAYQFDASNPDIVIAMRSVLEGDEEFESFFRECFDDMSQRFRQSVIDAERRLAQASDRNERRSSEQLLAMDCNQLAWLLGKCEQDLEEAIRLSQRSLELVPDEPAYLDTLARCYFSAGQVAKAVETQRRAVRLAPFERQMLAQLHEFEEALATQNAAAPPAVSP
ncbi:MAG: hypothetical protein KatS3mg111_1037 [Pirellulaceae bacterium]|nr:MAG: hypothetical protein KatS3mg111_1037 [Pirellulaceae bacterium]